MVTLNWHILSDGVTYRAAVFGGWLVRTEQWIESSKMNVNINSDNSIIPGTTPNSPYYSICFVPDPEHIWGQIEKVDKLLLKGIPNGPDSG